MNFVVYLKIQPDSNFKATVSYFGYIYLIYILNLIPISFIKCGQQREPYTPCKVNAYFQTNTMHLDLLGIVLDWFCQVADSSIYNQAVASTSCFAVIIVVICIQWLWLHYWCKQLNLWHVFYHTSPINAYWVIWACGILWHLRCIFVSCINFTVER